MLWDTIVRQPVQLRVARTELCACSLCADLLLNRVDLCQNNRAGKA